MDMGFGGLLQLGCKELRYELITWIIANYDIGYHRLCMHTNVVVLVTPQYVKEVLGIPNNGMDILIYNRRNTPNRTYDIQILEDNMRNLLVGEELRSPSSFFPVPLSLPPTQNKKVCMTCGTQFGTVMWVSAKIGLSLFYNM